MEEQINNIVVKKPLIRQAINDSIIRRISLIKKVLDGFELDKEEFATLCVGLNNNNYAEKLSEEKKIKLKNYLTNSCFDKDLVGRVIKRLSNE